MIIIPTPKVLEHHKKQQLPIHKSDAVSISALRDLFFIQIGASATNTCVSKGCEVSRLIPPQGPCVVLIEGGGMTKVRRGCQDARVPAGLECR